MTRKLQLECPHCGAKSSFPRDTKIPVKVKVLCGRCKEDITSEVKRALLLEVAVGISGKLVQRENRAFFDHLEEVWQGRADEPGEPLDPGSESA